MPAMPDSSVDKFTNPSAATDGADASPEQQETEEGTQYSDTDSAQEPALMMSNAQADAAGMTGAMPGDKFTVTVTVGDQSDDGWNVQFDPGSALKMNAPSPDDTAPPTSSSQMKGPSDFGIPTGLGASPTIGNT